MMHDQKRGSYSAHSVCRPSATAHGVCRIRSAGFTLIEVLVATALSLLMLTGVVMLFARVSESVTAARAMLESTDRLRLTAARLQQDLGGLTVDMSKDWHRPEDNEGYFEYIEGPITQANAATVAVSSDLPGTPGDTTVGDFDDILMFTTRSTGQPFVGKCGAGNTTTSDVAEVAWFVRGRTLYRRVLLVAPGLSGTLGLPSADGFYATYDLSVRSGATGPAWQPSQAYSLGAVVTPSLPNGHSYVCTTAGTSGVTQPTWPTTSGSMVSDGTPPTAVLWTEHSTVLLNSLGDLTNRQNRFAHGNATFPYDIGAWAWGAGPSWAPTHVYSLGAIVMPTSPNGRCYVCIAAGTSSSTEPTPWPTTGRTVTDGTVTWLDHPFVTLPTLRECSWGGWVAGNQPSLSPTLTVLNLDFWGSDPARRLADTTFLASGSDGARIADDVILTNVIGFDVKAWDPTANGGAGAYVDLGNGSGSGQFTGTGQTVGYTWNGTSWDPKVLRSVYDTWSNAYETVGTSSYDQQALSMGDGTTATRAGRALNGMDDYIVETTAAKNGVVDDSPENLTAPPYPVPLRGIQVKIRIFEPDSRQVREVTVVQDFLPQ
jgi:type II secretory pathway component PulJ